MLKFTANHLPLLFLGLLCAFLSSFGQTFLISLSLPHKLKDFSITKAQFGTLYSIGSVISGFAMLQMGPKVTAHSTMKYTVSPQLD